MDVAQRIQYQDDAPAAEPMRAQRRGRSNPSREDLKVRRRQTRAQRPAQPRTAVTIEVPDHMVQQEEDKTYITAGGHSIGPVMKVAIRCLACGCRRQGVPQGPRCPACSSLVVVATVLPTQIERANKNDMMRTPQGQSVKILRVRPHETEADKVYVDTDMGTSIMSRGTDVELVPYNSQQRELPGSGNPSGNTGGLPGAGRGAGGDTNTGQAPHCPVDGTKMVFRNNTWICPVDGTTAPTGSAPPGMSPVDWGRGNLVDRQRDRGVPQTHLWASKYYTIDRPSLVARSVQRVLSTMEENRS